MLTYKGIEIKHKINLSSVIKKDGFINLDFFSDTNTLKNLYGLSSIEDNSILTFVLDRVIVKKDNIIIKYVNDCGKGNFSIERYEKYLDYRKINPSDSFSETFFKLKYGLYYKKYLMEKKDRKPNVYSVPYQMDRYGLSHDEAMIKIKDLKFSTSGCIENYIEKYGEEEGSKRFQIFCNKSKLILNNFIINYGIEVGTYKYEEANIKRRYSNTLKGYIEKHGEEGRLKYEKVSKSKASTLENFIKNMVRKKVINFILKLIKRKATVQLLLIMSKNMGKKKDMIYTIHTL